jgi:proline iminopeptidase
MWNFPEEQEHVDFTRTDAAAPSFAALIEQRSSLRLLAALFLLDRSPDASENLLPQAETEELFVPVIAPNIGTLVCKGDHGKLPPLMRSMSSGGVNPHLNPLVNGALTLSTGEAAHDPHAVLRGNKTPAMILFAECDYLLWNGALDYRKTLANAKVYYMGHFIVFEQSELLRRMIVAFLLDQPDVVVPYAGDADPRTLHP